MFIIIKYRTGDRGEREEVEEVIGPFDTEEDARDYYTDKLPFNCPKHDIDDNYWESIEEMKKPEGIE